MFLGSAAQRRRDEASLYQNRVAATAMWNPSPGSPWLAAFPPAATQQIAILLGLGFFGFRFWGFFCQTPENFTVGGGLLLTPNELGFLRSVVRVPPPSL